MPVLVCAHSSVTNWSGEAHLGNFQYLMRSPQCTIPARHTPIHTILYYTILCACVCLNICILVCGELCSDGTYGPLLLLLF